ncbi:MAG: pyroglutamyl-peptidase I [Candidatus Thorarchaeota archaeon]|nr:pyroglutamyl-peptidase I [Candidatus Thorarchaeota archaeon]
MNSILLTGYEPFDGYSINPSEELVKHLNGTTVAGFKIVGKVLPLDYSEASNLLEKAIDQYKPKYVLCCGQANRSAITLEQVGLNVINTKREDNYGNKPESYKILPGAPAAYFSTIDTHPLVDAIKAKGIPADVSYNAGTYGCNWILFTVLHWIATQKVNTDAMFIHVPPLPEQAIEKDTMTLATMPLGIIADAISTIIQNLE